MSKKGFFGWVSIFETGLSATEWVWRIVMLLFVGGSGTLTALIAKTDPFLEDLGPIYWISVGLVTALVISLILFLVKWSQLKNSESILNNTMAIPRSTINPLAHNFSDAIIPVEDLRLPTRQLHENKHFKRCKFVGPAALAIQGGTYVNSKFNECGDVIALPNNTLLSGIIVLRNCAVEDCEFIRTTIFADQNTAKEFAGIPGARVKGLSA